MAVTKLQRDVNGALLVGHGSGTVTKRYTSVGTGGQAISLPADCKSVLIHIEGSTVVYKLTGTVSGSAQINITSDGYTLEDVPIIAEADATIVTVASSSGTINVSVIGWR